MRNIRIPQVFTLIRKNTCFEKSLFYAKRRESVKYNPIRWTCFYVEIKSTYFTSSKMRYSASICGMDKKKNR